MERSAEIIADSYHVVLLKGLELTEHFGHKVTNILLRYYGNLKLCLVDFFFYFILESWRQGSELCQGSEVGSFD